MFLFSFYFFAYFFDARFIRPSLSNMAWAISDQVTCPSLLVSTSAKTFPSPFSPQRSAHSSTESCPSSFLSHSAKALFSSSISNPRLNRSSASSTPSTSDGSQRAKERRHRNAQADFILASSVDSWVQ